MMRSPTLSISKIETKYSIRNKNDTFQANGAEIIDEASHHQYTSSSFIKEISNQLNDEI
jgi:hypothetical protein